MTQTSLNYDLQPDADTFTGRVAHLFMSSPGRWINAIELSQVGGFMAWRSRVSDARRDFGLNIVNRQRKVGKLVVSEYRLEV